MPIGGVNNPCSSCKGTGIDEGEFCMGCLGTGFTTDTGTKLFLKGLKEAVEDVIDKCNDIKEKVDEIKQVVDEL